MLKLFKPRFNPILIDLEQYEKDLLYAIEHGVGKTYWLLLKPAPSTPGLVCGSWSKSEIQAMKDNIEKAQEIYERLSKRIVHKNS